MEMAPKLGKIPNLRGIEELEVTTPGGCEVGGDDLSRRELHYRNGEQNALFHRAASVSR